MNNLYRELAPISEAAWAQIEEETARTFKDCLPDGASLTCRVPAVSRFRPLAPATCAILKRPAMASSRASAR